MTLWRVLIKFEARQVSYLVHIPTEEQQRGYRNDKLYATDFLEMAHLHLFTETATADEAKAKARQLLLDYVQGPVEHGGCHQ